MSENNAGASARKRRFPSQSELLSIIALGIAVSLLIELGYRRIFVNLYPMMIRQSEVGSVLLGVDPDPGPASGTTFNMGVNANRTAMSAGVLANGSTIGSITAANGRTVVVVATDRAGVPMVRFEDPATGITAFELKVLPDGSAEIYAPKGLTIVETPRGGDAERLSPADEDQPEDD